MDDWKNPLDRYGATWVLTGNWTRYLAIVNSWTWH